MDISSVVERLIEKNYSISTAESCTGGLIASAIVDSPGASNIFNYGVITYSDEMKIKKLGVNYETIKNCGVVSSKTAYEMARRIRFETHSDFSLSSTGIAGPGGGSPKKPVGLVYVACHFGNDQCLVKELHLKGDRTQVRVAATEEAFKLLEQCINEFEG